MCVCVCVCVCMYACIYVCMCRQNVWFKSIHAGFVYISNILTQRSPHQ